MKETTKAVVVAFPRLTEILSEAMQAAEGDAGVRLDTAFAAFTLTDGDPTLLVINRVADDLDRCDDEILHVSQRINERLAGACNSVRAGEHVPRLGVLANLGLDLDRLCAERALRVDHLRTLLHAWSQSQPVPSDDGWVSRGSNASPDRHLHRYEGQTLTHAHSDGRVPHGYYEHAEDGRRAHG